MKLGPFQDQKAETELLPNCADPAADLWAYSELSRRRPVELLTIERLSPVTQEQTQLLCFHRTRPDPTTGVNVCRLATRTAAADAPQADTAVLVLIRDRLPAVPAVQVLPIAAELRLALHSKTLPHHSPSRTAWSSPFVWT